MKQVSASQSEAMINRLKSDLSTVNWTDGTPIDRLDEYLSQAKRSTRVSTFGPTAAADSVLMSGRLTAKFDRADLTAKPIIKGIANFNLSWAGKRLMQELPEIQIKHRSRPGGLASNRLQINEFNKRVEAMKTNRGLLDSISLPDREALEINSIKKEAVLKRLKFDKDHLKKYIKEHEKSSFMPGVKWGQFDENDPIWKYLFEEVRGYMESKVFSGESWNTKFNIGSRQRPDQQVEPNETFYDLEVTRTRVVMFHPALSTVFAFMPDKSGFYDDVIRGATDVFKINDHIMSPLVDGGMVYGAAQDALVNSEDVTIILGDDLNIYKGGKQIAMDGVNWESSVGTILGAPFHGSKSYFGGNYHLPSGVFDTSIDGTLASMWVYSQMEHPEDEIPGVMERQKTDEEIGFMLGLAFGYDPNAPRLQGLKLNMDKADANVPLPVGRNLEILSRKKEDEIERWYLGYHGTTPTGGNLLDFLTDVTPDQFRGGEMSEWIEQGYVGEAPT